MKAITKAEFVALADDTYKVGNSENLISIEVDTSTTGVVSTLVIKNSLNPSNIILESADTDPTGKINFVHGNIGKGTDIKQLFISSLIDFTNISNENLQNAMDNTIVEYSLFGGITDPEKFDSTNALRESSMTNKTLRITKHINLI
jgi:hypothetical protein